MSSHPGPPIVFAALQRPASASPAQRTSPQRAAAPAPAITPTAVESAAFRAGVLAQNKRCSAIIYSAAFATNPVLTAHLLATTLMTAKQITGLVAQISTDDAAAPENQRAAIADRWAAAHHRAVIRPGGQ
jgi:hypothetical protein